MHPGCRSSKRICDNLGTCEIKKKFRTSDLNIINIQLTKYNEMVCKHGSVVKRMDKNIRPASLMVFTILNRFM